MAKLNLFIFIYVSQEIEVEITFVCFGDGVGDSKLSEICSSTVLKLKVE